MLRIGARGSKLALWQAHWVETELKRHWPDLNTEILTIKTEGDNRLDVNLSVIGGKSMFVKDIEDSLLGRKIDVAVHSLKDLPFDLPDGLTLAAVPMRADPSDVLVLPPLPDPLPRGERGEGSAFSKLPAGTKIGTSSIRRKCQLIRLRSDLIYEDLRGNIDTRIRKMEEGKIGGLVLAKAGLDRLGFSHLITETLPIISAVGQGALALEAREKDQATLQFLKPLNDPLSFLCVSAERAFLKVMGGNCQVPLACHVFPQDELVKLNTFVSDLKGQEYYDETLVVPQDSSLRAAQNLATRLLKRGGSRILKALLTH